MFKKIEISNILKVVILGDGLTGIFLLVAMALYPNYNQFDQTISKLGTQSPSSFFFSLALLIQVVTFSYLLSKLKNDNLNLFKEYKREFATIYIMYNLMIFCLIGVVIFPSKGTTSDIHDIVAIILFLLMAIATFWVSTITKSELENWNKSISYLGYLCSISVVILGFLLTFGEFGPVIQKITVVLFNGWVIMTVYELQKHSHSKA
ncbi:MAG: DUF998 domain-containing protein [Candidatus Hodarchaeales archaeon]|jgi:hypothetical protein